MSLVPQRLRLALLSVLLCTVGCSGATPKQPTVVQVSAEHGRTLFRNKGCVTCHIHTEVEGETGLLEIGPDLSTYRGDAEFLRQWLADHRALRPDTPMPDLNLSAAEIEDLIAFLNAERQ